MDGNFKTIASNKKAYHDYFVDETYECGIQLSGTEVKSVRLGHCSVKEAYIRPVRQDLYVMGMHINPYEKGNIFNKDPLRDRKLLLHRNEIRKILTQLSVKGVTLIPLEVYFKGSLVKVKLGICRGKKLYDKRDDLAKRDQKRELERTYKSASIRI